MKAERAKHLLTELANSHDDRLAYFDGLSGKGFESEIPIDLLRSWKTIIDFDSGCDDPFEPPDRDFIRKHWLKLLRDAVRIVWSLPDLRSKRWAVHSIIEQLLGQGDPRFIFTPMAESDVVCFWRGLKPPGHLEEALEMLVSERSYHLAHKCANPGCLDPYFFGKPSQKYCRVECAEPAQRKSKKKWWDNNGEEWRSKHLATRRPKPSKTSRRYQLDRNRKSNVDR